MTGCGVLIVLRELGAEKSADTVGLPSGTDEQSQSSSVLLPLGSGWTGSVGPNRRACRSLMSIQAERVEAGLATSPPHSCSQ